MRGAAASSCAARPPSRMLVIVHRAATGSLTVALLAVLLAGAALDPDEGLAAPGRPTAAAVATCESRPADAWHIHSEATIAEVASSTPMRRLIAAAEAASRSCSARAAEAGAERWASSPPARTTQQQQPTVNARVYARMRATNSRSSHLMRLLLLCPRVGVRAARIPPLPPALALPTAAAAVAVAAAMATTR